MHRIFPAFILLLGAGCTASSPSSTSEDLRVEKKRSTREAILDAVIQNALRSGPDPNYGTPGQMRLALASDSHVPWPPDYFPILEDYRVEYRRSDSPRSRDEDRIMGIRVDQYIYPELEDDDKPNPNSAVVAITVFNLGGTRNGTIIGGCNMTFRVKRIGVNWVAECEYVVDG